MILMWRTDPELSHARRTDSVDGCVDNCLVAKGFDGCVDNCLVLLGVDDNCLLSMCVE